MAEVTYIDADGASHTVEVATGENVMRGAKSRSRCRNG